MRFVDDGGAPVLDYTGLIVLDADGEELGARFERSAEGLLLSIDERDARYPLTVDPIAQQAYLKASNPDQNDFFGWAVAVSGDTLVVGAEREDSSASGVNGNQADNGTLDAGAAYVFVRNGTGWSQQAYLKASNPGVLDHFGGKVAISGDTIVIGANQEDSDGVGGDQNNNFAPDAGAAYVFVRNGTSWSQQAYLKASNTGSSDFFGFSASISGDTALVGAVAEDSNATGVGGDQSNNSSSASGAAYVFVRDGTSWSQEAYLKRSVVQPNGSFGRSLWTSDDTLVVTSDAHDSATEVFVREDETWSHQATLVPSGAASSPTCIGSTAITSVAVSGELVMVTDPKDESNATGVNGPHNNLAPCSGAAYLFRRSGTSWTEEAFLKASNTELVDQFGCSVAISGNTVVVGALHEDSGATGVNGDQGDNSVQASGAAYVFEICAAPAVAFRNGGTNPASYEADPIAIGGTFTATVDNGLAGQLTSLLIAFDSPFTFTLGGGQTLLCLDLGGSGERFTVAGLAPSSSAGGVDSFSLPFADDPATCGVVYYSQAIQFGNPPFVLSNAQDLTIGSP